MKERWQSVTALLLVAVLCSLSYVDQKQIQHRAELLRQYGEDARPYEQEIRSIRSELKKRERELKRNQEVTGILFGFVPSSERDLDDIETLAATYGITPVILLDGSLKRNTLRAIAMRALDESYEIAFTGTAFRKEALQNADEMKKLLERSGYEKESAFLLRDSDDSEENRDLLQKHGYSELFRYSDFWQNGALDGTPYLCYGFFRTPDYYSYYMSRMVDAHTMMLAVFDFSELQSGRFRLSDVNTFLMMAGNRKARKELQFMDLDTAFAEVLRRTTMETDKKEAYAAYRAEQEANIRELEEELSEIYAGWSAKERNGK